jgi:hypothetical protein
MEEFPCPAKRDMEIASKRFFLKFRNFSHFLSFLEHFVIFFDFLKDGIFFRKIREKMIFFEILIFLSCRHQECPIEENLIFKKNSEISTFARGFFR